MMFFRQRLSYTTKIVIIVCMHFWCIGGLTLVFAQQSEIAIVLPKKTPQVSAGDVQYARSVAKRFNRMLNGIGLTAVTLEEASLSEGQLKSLRLVILPLNPVITAQTTNLLRNFVANGGKLFVTYTLPDTAAPLLGLRQTDWVKTRSPWGFCFNSVECTRYTRYANIYQASIMEYYSRRTDNTRYKNYRVLA